MDVNVIAAHAWLEGLHSINWRQELYNAVRDRINRDPTFLNIHYDSVTDASTGRYTTTLEVTIDDAVHSYKGVPQYNNTTAIRCVSWMALVDLHQQGIVQVERSLTAT
jgi:hypothetical protein